MEGEELFGGFDMDFLANAESTEELESVTKEKQKSVNTDDFEKDEEDIKDDSLSLNLEDFADYDPASDDEDDTDSTDKNTDEKKNSHKQKELSSSPITSLTSALYEEGVLSSLTEEELGEIKSGEDLINVIRDQIRANELSDLNDDQKEYLEALRNGVPDVDYKSAKSAATKFNQITEESLEDDEAEGFRKQLLVQDFLTKGFSQATAEKYAARSVDLGEDVEDAKDALRRLKESETIKVKQMSEQAKVYQESVAKSQSERLQTLKSKVNELSEVVPGVRINSQTKEKVFNLMTKTAGFDTNNNPMNAVVKEMVENPDYLVKLFTFHELTDGFKDWSKIQSGAKRNAVNKLDESLRAQDAKIRTGSDKVTSPTASKGILSALDNLF